MASSFTYFAEKWLFSLIPFTAKSHILLTRWQSVGFGSTLRRHRNVVKAGGRAGGKKLTIYVLVFFIVQEMPVLVKYRILTPTLVY